VTAGTFRTEDVSDRCRNDSNEVQAMGLFDWLFRNKTLPTVSTHAGSSIAVKVGDRVLARGFDGYFYPGLVGAIDGDRCEIQFDDGALAGVHRANVRRPDVVVGSQVDCRANAGPAYVPGVVAQQMGEKLRIRYEGGAEEWTTLSLVRVKREIADVGDDPRPVSNPMTAPGMTGPGMPGLGTNPMPGPPLERVILDAGPPRDDPNWRSGDRVLARWWDLFWYPGSILAIGEKGYHILFDDGDQRIVSDLHLMPLLIEDGEEIYIRPKNQPQRIFMPATATRVKGEIIDVDFEDGGSETNTRVSRARFWRCPVGFGSFAFEEGERILAQDIDGCTYPAEIVSIDGDKIIVQFLDGPERMLTPELIRRFELKVGMPVESRWRGGQRFFRGTIQKLEGDRVFLHYDDGDEEWSNVRLLRLPPSDAPPG
jgi:hypothetical protein